MAARKPGESKADTKLDRSKGIKETSKRDTRLDAMPRPKKSRGK